MTPGERLKAALAAKEDKQEIGAARYSPKEGEEVGGFRGAAADVLENILPFVGMPERIEENRPPEGYSTMQRTGLGLAKGLSFAQMGNIGALGEELVAQVRGTGDEATIGERRQRYNEAINEESNLVGEVGGSIIGAPRVAFNAAEKGLKQLPQIAQLLQSRGILGALTRGTATASLAATEAGLYALSEGKDLDDAKSAALLGGGLGALGQLGAEGIGALLRTTGLSSKFGMNADRQVAENFVESMKATHGEDYVRKEFGQYMLDEDAIASAMRAGAGDETILELFPAAMLENFKNAIKTQNIDVYAAMKPLRDFMEARQLTTLPRFQQAIADVLQSQDVRSLDGVVMAVNQANREAMPLYDDALSAAAINPKWRMPGGKARPVRPSQLKRLIDAAFKGEKSKSAMRVRDHLKALVPDQPMTPRNMLSFRKELDNYLYGKANLPSIGGFSELSSINKEVLANAGFPLRRAIRDLTYDIAPKLKELDARFASDVAARNAYEAGYDMFRGKGMSSESVELFNSAVQGRTPVELGTFTEGVKRALLEELEGKTGKQLENYFQKNVEKLKALEGIIGQDAVALLRTEAGRAAATTTMTRQFDVGAPATVKTDEKFLPSLADIGILGSGFTSYGSTPAAQGAFRRLLPQHTSGAGNVGRAAATAQLGTLPADAAAQQVNEELMRSLPTLLRGTPGFAPVATGED